MGVSQCSPDEINRGMLIYAGGT